MISIYDILTAYINLLWNQFQYDVSVLSQPWMYWCFLIPAIAYGFFFIIKWALLTAPLWIPFKNVIGGLISIVVKGLNKEEK